MRETVHGSAAVSAPLASRSLAQVVVASLAMVALTVGLVALVAQPALVVGLLAVALAARMRHAVTVPVARRARKRRDAERQRVAAD
ncbi:MAG: hypothetical protein ABEJ26_03685 [Halosimplex sp.]